MTDLINLARERVVAIDSRTHWVGCERDHRECLIQRMADEIESLRSRLADSLRAEEHAGLQRDKAERLVKNATQHLRAAGDADPGSSCQRWCHESADRIDAELGEKP